MVRTLTWLGFIIITNISLYKHFISYDTFLILMVLLIIYINPNKCSK